MRSNFFVWALLIIVILIQTNSNRTIYHPNEIVSQIGAGFDVAWSQFKQKKQFYTSAIPTMISAAGFKNVRIRLGQNYPNSTFISDLQQQVNDSLQVGLIPIIAHQAHILETGVFTTIQQEEKYMSDFYVNLTKAFLGNSYKICFNIWVQISGKFKTDYQGVNRIYKNITREVRKIDPYRILVISPVSISDPAYLKYLIVPDNDIYTFVQWHFYAAGPSKLIGSKKYWIDGSTAAQRNGIKEPLAEAVSWMNGQGSGYKTWVGAWMPGNYNKGGNYTVQEQVGFASFMTRCLNGANIPHSINTDDKFINIQSSPKVWFTTTINLGGIPVRDAIIDPQSIALYSSQSYSGSSIRLKAGNYDESDLQEIGFTSANSLMVPLDYRVKLYSQSGFVGTFSTFNKTVISLNERTIKSIRVEYNPLFI